MFNQSSKKQDGLTAAVRLLIFTAVVVSFPGCGAEKSTEEKARSNSPAGKPVLVELAEVSRGLIEEILERSSPLVAEAQVQVLARTPNPAIELLVEEGDRVTKGQVLLRLENDRQTTDHEQAMTQLEKARVDFDTTESLYQENLISETEYRNAKFVFDQARLQSETAKRQLEYTEVLAPIDGTITSRTVKVGDQVNLGTPIFEIVDLDSIVAVIHVPEQYLPKLRPNMEARLVSTTLGDQAFAGYVKRISPIVDPQLGTIKVTIGVKELGALRPGLWVNVELVLDAREDALLIPKRAIVYDNDQTYAFKVFTNTNGVQVAKRELVVPLNADKVHIEPKEGFQVGDQIVVAGQSGLKDDAPIRQLTEPDAGDVVSSAYLAPSKTSAVSSAAKTTDPGVN